MPRQQQAEYGRSLLIRASYVGNINMYFVYTELGASEAFPTQE